MDNRKYTPENITHLDRDDVFVFGSNLQGQHHGGAARTAFNLFGAEWGNGEGPQGQSYAIPTMQGPVETIKPYVDRFIDYARECDQNTFYVTRIGCGIAGFTDQQIAPLFDAAYDLYNVRLPRSFSEIIERNRAEKNSSKSVWQQMLDGEIYPAADHELLSRLMDTRCILHEFNSLQPDNVDRQHEILRGLLGQTGEKFHINQPFRCDYGCNISIGENFFANFNLTVLDEAKVTIGDNVFIGPNVNIYTACHPIDADQRDSMVEWAEPVSIGNSVWIGGNTTILPGVSIGNRSVIGAGSVVTRDIPDSVVAAGNPARVIKQIP